MASVGDLSFSPSTMTSESNLQPFFVLHTAATPRKPVAKARRKIYMSPKSCNASAEEREDTLRLETFNFLWSCTESSMKDALKGINGNLFGEIDKWVHESFGAIRDLGKLHCERGIRPLPILDCSTFADEGASRQIFTAWLFTKNIDSVDDISTFVDLGEHLKASGCYVAHLSSLDFSSKNGVGGCLKTLLKQFLTVGNDVADISVLASWYFQQVKYESPLVVIIDEVERCCASVLADFISMLREWLIKIPIILIFGVATTVDFLRGILCSETCLHLCISEFTLRTLAERMDAVVEAVLKSGESFIVGSQVLGYLREYFSKDDGTLTLFIRALRIAVVQHIYTASGSFCKLAKGSRDRSSQPSPVSGEMSEVKKLCKLWSSVVMCLFEVGKYRKLSLLDLYCEILGAGPQISANDQLFGQLKNEGHLIWAYSLIRDLPAAKLCNLLKRWEVLTKEFAEIHEKVKQLQNHSAVEVDPPNPDTSPKSKRLTARNYKKACRTTVNEKAAAFLQWFVRECIQSIETTPLSRSLVFNDIDKLRVALIGDPRRGIQSDLVDSTSVLKCLCCCKNGGVLVPSMHNASIIYTLAQEHGDLINLHEWFHSFKTIVSSPPSKSKKSRTSPSPRKQKVQTETKRGTEASVQAEFCKAVIELQITGLLRLPTKRRPDFVQRAAFGL